jgi:phosphoribosylformylglycinamidine synthase
VAQVPASYLTEEVPVYTREQKEPAYYKERKKADLGAVNLCGDFTKLLTDLLSSPNLSRKSWVYEQYDYMVGLNTIIRPGGDGALLRLPGTQKALALSVDCNSRYVFLDPYLGGALAVAEAALNVAVTGARPLALTNCLNFGNPENPEIYWQFVWATDGLAKAAEILETPVTGGNVSFYNEYDGQAIFPTHTIGMVGLLTDINNRLTLDFKDPGDIIMVLGQSREELGASEAHYLLTGRDEGPVPQADLLAIKNMCRFLESAAANRLLKSAHDCADGGLAVALAESAMVGGHGFCVQWSGPLSPGAAFFGESSGRVLVSLNPEKLSNFQKLLEQWSVTGTELGRVGGTDIFLQYNDSTITTQLHSLQKVWTGALAALAAL